MASTSKARVLKHGDDLVFMLESRDKWVLSKILEQGFFKREPMSGTFTFKRANEDDNAHSQLLHQTVVVNHSQGNESLSILVSSGDEVPKK